MAALAGHLEAALKSGDAATGSRCQVEFFSWKQPHLDDAANSGGAAAFELRLPSPRANCWCDSFRFGHRSMPGERQTASTSIESRIQKSG